MNKCATATHASERSYYSGRLGIDKKTALYFTDGRQNLQTNFSGGFKPPPNLKLIKHSKDMENSTSTETVKNAGRLLSIEVLI
jgi:hypothetical protein